MKRKADYILDVRGTISPFSLLKVSQMFQKMKPRETMDILGCDGEMQVDLFKVLPGAAYELISAEIGANDPETARVRIRKSNNRFIQGKETPP